MLVIGSMISLGYYLRVVATMWMGPGAAQDETRVGARLASPGRLAPIAGGSSEADTAPGRSELSDESEPGRAAAPPEVLLVAVIFSAASVFFGIFPSPLFHLAAHAGNALSGLF